ncbi:MAG: 3-methyl-2-oxobutanoate hydroxymethyltransferase [Verrucomicrobiota bacterium]|nr:3-methyl-2-oxobutanoate hydroxymethyltransferase [Limisphaera sp.]MDW8381643.1 3-methyl-2-oxobutanoate hydroxymethyltransferase [Verrucomicrobiota bacterium]
MHAAKVTPDQIRAMKQRGEKIAALTTYDYPTTRLLDEAGLPLLLVGDSLGMVVLGMPDTTGVTLEMMEHHVRAAARACPRALLAADLPANTYETPDQAVQSARRLMRAGAEAIKAEGGRAILPQVRALIGAGIPYIGHIGMLPQSVHQEGGYHIKGRTEDERHCLLADAEALAHAGAFAIVLELVSSPVAAEITRRLSIPTIGIGSGPHCDGQILVTHDLMGLLPWLHLRHAQPLAQLGRQIIETARQWQQQIQARSTSANVS